MGKILFKLLKPDRIDENGDWIFETSDSKARVRYLFYIIHWTLSISLGCGLLFLFSRYIKV